MTAENWIAVIAIPANFIAIIAGAEISAARVSRSSQPKEMAEPIEHQIKRRKWRELLLRAWGSPWVVPPALLILSIYNTYTDVYRATPLTQRVAFQISFDVAGGVCAVVLFCFSVSCRLMVEGIAAQRDMNRLLIDSHRRTD